MATSKSGVQDRKLIDRAELSSAHSNERLRLKMDGISQGVQSMKVSEAIKNRLCNANN